MADTLDGINTLATDPAFAARVKAAVVHVATNVIKATLESQSPTEIDKHRRDLAMRVIGDRDTFAGHFTWMLASRQGLTGSITDAALVTAVETAWNYLAGISL